MQYTLEYDAEMCEWYATADGQAVYADTQQEAQLWLAAQIRNAETQEEREWYERAVAAAQEASKR